MKNMALMLVGLCLVGIQGIEAQEKAAAFPTSAQMERYPIITDTVGHVAKMAEMGLRRCTLRTDWTGLNWYQNYQGARFGRFVYETLSTGTEAWCDPDGVPLYKADCVNRLATEEDCPNCLTYEPNRPVGALTVQLDSQSAALFSRRDTVVIENQIYLPAAQNGPSWLSRHRWEVGGVTALLAGLCAWKCRLNVYQGPPR